MEKLYAAETGILERLEVGGKPRLRSVAADDVKPRLRAAIERLRLKRRIGSQRCRKQAAKQSLHRISPWF
jgi:hypothetical protein